MDFDLRLKALTRLAESETEAAKTALQKELDKVAASLEVDSEYGLLEQNLEILATIGYRGSAFVVDVLVKFIHVIESRKITYSEQEALLQEAFGKYHTASSLVVRAVEVLIRLRYLETKRVLQILMGLSNHPSDSVRKKAFEGLEALANYDIRVFYGDGQQAGIGATPQKHILDEIEPFKDIDITNFFSGILSLVDAILSPTMEGTSSSYKSVTWSRAATPGHPSVAEIRFRSINLLKRMYELAKTLPEKLQVIAVLNNATRTHMDGKIDKEISDMIVRDNIDVLSFFADLIRTEDLQIVQKIESNSYWIYYHAIHREIETAALVVCTAIADHSEYQIYKVLIGFEGIFGDWSKLRKTDSQWEEVSKFREEKALEYAGSITSANYAEWRQRILKYAETQSEDLATFPIFYRFLESFATRQPTLALQLISTDSKQIDRFLIPLLRGLWAGPERSGTKKLIESWIGEGLYLNQCTKLFLASEHLDQDLLALLLRKATEIDDLQTVGLIMSVAVTNFDDEKRFLIEKFFVPALEVLTQHSNVNWIFDLWFRRETRGVINILSESHLELVLHNLLALGKIDYHAEEILYLIALRTPVKVLEFLCERLVKQSQERERRSSIFDAVPYSLHKLNQPLSKIPTEAVRLVRERYDGNYPMFIYRGARLLKIIFPQFPAEFEAELLNLVRAGGEANLEFVLAVLRNYHGEPFIHRVCKEIVRAIPADSPFRTEVAVALENTGVVEGEFGVAEAYERKKNEVKDWITDADEKIQDFAKWYMADLEQMSADERKHAEERIALRKYRYGDEE
jgi:hypothetical protein